EAIAGATLFQSRGCGLCHTLNGVGAKMAPVLNGLAARRTRDWVAGHFGDPPRFSPNSQMPAYKFNDQDLAAITNYLMGIPK
ncbi:MAG TPA: cytochrome c, partial [Bryobacteraceae bacterium]